MINCNTCGAENTQNAKFCVSCGNPLKKTTNEKKETDTSTHSQEKNVEININFDFAKKGIDSFKTLSKNQQVIAALILITILVFFFMNIIAGGKESIGFFDIIQLAKKDGGKTAISMTKYIWLFLFIPIILGVLVYLYNFFFKTLSQKLNVLLGINFVSTMMFTVLLLMWFSTSAFINAIDSYSYSARMGIDFSFGFYLYFFSFIGIIVISSIEIANLFRKRR